MSTNNEIIIKERDFKAVCCICGKPCKKTDYFIGGYLNWCHNSCSKHAEKAIDLYLKWISLSHVGMINFAKHIIDVNKDEDDS